MAAAGIATQLGQDPEYRRFSRARRFSTSFVTTFANRNLGELNASSKKGILFVAGFSGKLLESFKESAASTALQADIQSVLLFAGEQRAHRQFNLLLKSLLVRHATLLRTCTRQQGQMPMLSNKGGLSS